jgi:hypothetical protein
MAALVFLLGCSTLVNGLNQNVKLPKHCYVQSGSNETYPVDGIVAVRRSSKPITVICGDTRREVQPEWTRAAKMGAVLLDFGLVDSATGAAWHYPMTIEQ